MIATTALIRRRDADVAHAVLAQAGLTVLGELDAIGTQAVIAPAPHQ